MTNRKIPVGILGAGISGLSAAYALQRKGITATVYEKSASVGGVIQSMEDNGWMVEEGPNTLIIKSDAVWKLLRELGLEDETTEANPSAKKRYVIKNKELEPLPSSFGSFFKTALLSPGAKLQLLKEPFVAPSHLHDESIASFIKRRLGEQVLDYGMNPFVSGIYAGDPKKLSVKHTFSMLWEMEQEYGSLSKGLMKRERSNSSKRKLVSFKNGIQTLPTALAEKLNIPVQVSAKITAAKKQDEKWDITGISNEEKITASHDCLISTLPAYSLSDIFDSKPFNEFKNLPYAPLSMVALGFKAGQLNHPLDGFGMLIPEVENFKTLGVLFSSTLFPNRAPKGHQLLTCFMGGARNPEYATKPKGELVEKLLLELDQLLGINGDPLFIHHKYWKQAIPQYEVGYDYFLSLFKEAEQENPGLYLDGNFRNGVSVPDCISSGFETAHKVQMYLKGIPSDG